MRVIVVLSNKPLTLKVNSHTPSDTPLDRVLARANGHVEIDIGRRAVKDGLLDAELDERGINIVGLGRTIIASSTVCSAALVIGAAHSQALSVAGAGRGGVALGAVDKGDVVPDLAAGDRVLELRVLAVLDAVG